MKNNQLGKCTKNTVLAAYVNYSLGEREGQFNDPAVLFADAVIFAFGGSHFELGEHLASKEYLPNSNLIMSEDLKKSLISYYDFLVAYQSILRDGGTFNQPEIKETEGKISLEAWPPETGQMTVIGKMVNNRQIIHLINFKTNTLDWRDTNGKKIIPGTIRNIRLSYFSYETISRIWCATPDFNYGSPLDLAFVRENNSIHFTVPYLKYWDMIVIE